LNFACRVYPADEEEETTMAKTKRAKVCIDRILPSKIMAAHRVMRMADGHVRAISPIGKTWINGSTLHVKFLEGTSKERAKVREQAGWWTEVANLKFEFDDASDAEIRITFDKTDGAWSYVGTDCKEIPVDQPTMNLGFLDGGTAAHEFGHAIGLAHEHQNPAGGIQWNEEVVIAELSKPPNSWTPEVIRHNVIEKYSADQINGTEFDPDSIMLYFFPPEWTLNGIGTKENDVLSDMDKEFVAGAKMYPKKGPTVSGAVVLNVGAVTRTRGSIGKFGEEDLYKFTADSDGRYVIDSLGDTDVVMKLFGPDNQTALIAEDDDSGVDLNARIIADLIPGEYYVQIRHYNLEGGTGEYTVGVSKQ
jgi:hypothetical protein